MKQINIGLLGMGNIGTGTYQVLEEQREHILQQTGLDLQITRILEKFPDRPRPVAVPREKFTQDVDDILNDPTISIVIELLGGVEPATTYMVRAMEKGKHVVTANKAAIAANMERLFTAEKNHGVEFRYEASVGGAIPVLTALQEALAANTFEGVYGIVNGTTNYILTKMADEGLSYESALRQAQELGFAEADPAGDVEGHDAANKLSILLHLCFDARVRPEAIPTTGITGVTKQDMQQAAAAGKRIKLIASAQKKDGKLVYSVEPTALPLSHPLASVNNELNAIYVQASHARELMFYGRGAGPLPTGSAVLGDVIAIGRQL